jgi:hypothetical protein
MDANKEKLYVGYPEVETSPEGFNFEHMSFDGVKLIITTKTIDFKDCDLKNVTIEFYKISFWEKVKKYFKNLKPKQL